MKKKIILIIMFLFAAVPAFAQTETSPKLIGVNGGVGLPFEVYDLEAMGINIHLGFDYAHPVKNNLAVGFYLNLGGGVMGALHPYSEYDRYYYPFRFSAGLLAEIGDLQKRPFILGVAPCTGMGFVDMDLFIPLEIRFGRFITDNWYIVAELTYGISLAHETAYLEPSIRVGYNFGRKSGKKQSEAK